jgi:hypothetical protein
VAAAVESGHDHLLQESQIGLPLKIILLMKVDETGVVQAHSSEDLLCMARSSRENLRLTSPFGPCRMQGKESAETKPRPRRQSPRLRFWLFFRFLDSGTCSAPICAVASHRSDQPGRWPLHRVAQLPEQLAHMPGVISLPEFLRDDLAYQRTGPDPSLQTVSHRSTI